MHPEILAIVKRRLNNFYNQPSKRNLDEYAYEMTDELDAQFMATYFPVKPDFDNPNHNNSESAEHYQANKGKFHRQCKILYNILMSGETESLTILELMNPPYNIGDPRKRLSELHAGKVKFQSPFLTTEEVKVANVIFKKKTESYFKLMLQSIGIKQVKIHQQH